MCIVHTNFFVTVGRVFKCEYEGCTYQAVRKHRYLDHLNKHTGVRNYICPTCGKAFGAKKHLFRHENIHKEGKNVVCPPGGKLWPQCVEPSLWF